VASNLAWRGWRFTAPMLSCNGSLKRRKGGACMEFDVKAPCSASRKCRAVLRESSISCHSSKLKEGAEVVESTAFSELSKRPASGSVLSAQRLTSLTSASEALESSSLSRTIGSSILRQKKLIIYFHNRSGSACAYLNSCLSYHFVLTCSD